MNNEELFAELESNGIEQVRKDLHSEKYGIPNSLKYIAVQHWIDNKYKSLELEASLQRDEREEKTLELAKESNRLSKRANSIAFFAAIMAIIVPIMAIAITSII